MLERMEATTFDTTGGGATPARRETIVRTGDSLRVETILGDQRRSRTVAAGANVLPFIDMVHWPYEIALMRLTTGNTSELSQPLLTGSRVSNFAIAHVGKDSMTITHPSRGTMRLRVDPSGRLMSLDAGATTRKLLVERRPWMPIDDIVRRWTAQDAAGRSLGALSGRAQSKDVIGGAGISLDHGTPLEARAHDLGRTRPVRQRVAYRRQRGDSLRNRSGSRVRRRRGHAGRSGRPLHALLRSRARWRVAHHQSRNGPGRYRP